MAFSMRLQMSVRGSISSRIKESSAFSKDAMTALMGGSICKELRKAIISLGLAVLKLIRPSSRSKS